MVILPHPYFPYFFSIFAQPLFGSFFAQRHAPDDTSLAMSEQPVAPRGRSRRPSSAGRVSERRQLHFSADDFKAMVAKEVETVERELVDGPSSSLLALEDARKEMDDMAMKAQVCAL